MQGYPALYVMNQNLTLIRKGFQTIRKYDHNSSIKSQRQVMTDELLTEIGLLYALFFPLIMLKAGKLSINGPQTFSKRGTLHMEECSDDQRNYFSFNQMDKKEKATSNFSFLTSQTTQVLKETSPL